jgi:hypothetical protein
MTCGTVEEAIRCEYVRIKVSKLYQICVVFGTVGETQSGNIAWAMWFE